MRAYIVVDLGFGDAGKGLLTDYLARQTGAGLVVRYNGGAQAGHNVVTPDGRQHTFSQFGSGTFLPGVRTYLSQHVVVHPAALLAEGDLLREKGLPDVFSRLRVSDRALIVTPFHQAANRIRELARGADRHGSCGVGVGEAVEDARAHPADSLLAGDLARPAVLRRKLQNIREQKREEMIPLYRDQPAGSRLAGEGEIFEREDVIEAWLDSIARIGELDLVVSDSVLEGWLGETETAIFEGAQGVLLDAEAGFHPYTTWSRCTAGNAIELLAEMAPDADAFRIGVLRSYVVRHGPGPLPTETGELAPAISEHNKFSEWQGAVRYGWFDAVMARYALEIAGGVDSLMVTHLDVPPRLEAWQSCSGYRDVPDLDGPSFEVKISAGLLESFRARQELSLEQRVRLTRALATARPALETCGTEEKTVIQKIEALLGQPVDLLSRGPQAGDVQILNTLPA